MNSYFTRIFLTVACASLFTAPELLALENGLAETPPMGFNTWNWFKCGDANHGAINEALIKGIADAMVSSGMKDSGYQYVNIDDCWGEASRDARGGIVANRSRFPGGMKALADYVHAKGLKLGLYTDVANLTCAKSMPGLSGHENQDCDTFVTWGIDYVKVDWCNSNGAAAPPAYTKVRNALRSAVTRMRPTIPTAHEICFSICNWGEQSPWLWADTIGNLWRTTGDIDWSGGCSGHACWGGIMATMDGTANHYRYAGPGHWNDPDMMQVGNGGTNTAEDRSHFSLWCMMAAPLIAGNDIRSMSATTRNILTNGEAIRVNQDSLGAQGVRVTSGNSEVWVKKLLSQTSVKTDTNYAVLFFNRNNGGAVTMSVSVSQITNAVKGGMTNGKIYTVRDLWGHKDLGEWTAGTYTTPSGVGAHDVFMIRLAPKVTVETLPVIVSVGTGKIQLNIGERITVTPTISGPLSVTMVDLKGTTVYSQRNINSRSHVINSARMQQGVYLIKVLSGSESTVRRVVLK
jgi:alpha-galactosidase